MLRCLTLLKHLAAVRDDNKDLIISVDGHAAALACLQAFYQQPRVISAALRLLTGLLTKRVQVVPLRSLRVSSGSGSEALVNYQSLETYWESDQSANGSPHWIEVTIPAEASWTEAQIYMGDLTAFSPERITVLAGVGAEPLVEIKQMYVLHQSKRSHGHSQQATDVPGCSGVTASRNDIPRNRLWITLATAEEVLHALPARDGQDVRLRLQITRSHGGGSRCRVCAVRIAGPSDTEAEEQVERRRIAVAALDGLSLAMECAHQHQSDRDIVQACRSFLHTYVAGDLTRDSFVRECGGAAYL